MAASSLTLALAGDTMLGRGVGERLERDPLHAFVAPELVDVLRDADLFVLNLECAISRRGSRWPDPDKPFFFRAPPAAADLLAHLGTDCVTLANNHALDYGPDALLDTFTHLADAGVRWVGAGPDERTARTPLVLERRGTTVAAVGLTDHPREYAATPSSPGVAHADLWHGTPGWVVETLQSVAADIVLALPHWGPNMVAEPVPHVRRAARALRAAGATLVAGHSAHVFHGLADGVLYDLGDFLDDYATEPVLRNDLGLLFLVTFEGRRLVEVEALPLKLGYCRTGLATGEDADWIRRRFRSACAALGTSVRERDGRIVVSPTV